MFSFSPELFAAYHVFPRLPTPRHPPDALVNLFLEKNFLIPYSIVNELQPVQVTLRSDWWAWKDLNFRPHAYQACALTT